VRVVHQLLSGAGPYDAITTEALAFRSAFRRWGWDGRDFAHRIAPAMRGRVEEARRLAPAPGDVLLIHHSAALPALEGLLALPNPKLLLYHNITPADWLWDVAPLIAIQCAAGRAQLAELVAAVNVAAADSAFNAAELAALGAGHPEVIPLLVELDQLGLPGPARPVAPEVPTILFVGRLSPHKRQAELIRVFALLRGHRATQARLVLVGDPVHEGYDAQLAALADSLVPGAVSIESGLAPSELAERYRRADAFVCLSAHEGFCIPLLEAFHFGVPVLARPVGAVGEVVGDAAVLADEDDPAVLAEAIHLVLSDRELRGELRRRGRRRLHAFAPEVTEARLREAVEATVAAGDGRVAGFGS
jgi:glycosyltransferase involved in cell wall biosynthesis